MDSIFNIIQISHIQSHLTDVFGQHLVLPSITLDDSFNHQVTLACNHYNYIMHQINSCVFYFDIYGSINDVNIKAW